MIERVHSPNFGDRRGCDAPSLVILHYTAMERCNDALARLCAPEHEVSAHYLIAADGRILQLVDETKRAWHAGASAWHDIDDVNSHSIGIELDNAGSLHSFKPFPEAQMQALETLLTDILPRWSIAPRNVLGHSDVAVGRKADPGPKFDWARLAARGLAQPHPQPQDQPVDQSAFETALHAYGYHGNGQPLLDAFRLRWRQGATGPLNARDMGIAAALAMA